MIYLHRGMERAACETEPRAQALEAHGYRRCSAAVHRALWAIADATAQAQMRAQVQPQSEATVTAPIGSGDRPPAEELVIVREKDGGTWVLPRKVYDGGLG